MAATRVSVVTSHIDSEESSVVQYTIHDSVAVITLHRPDALNALTIPMLCQAADMVDRATKDDTIRVIVLTGSGKAFSAGVDLKALGGRAGDMKGGNVGPVLDVPARHLIRTLESTPKVVIGAINGHCYTGALELALACDILVAAEGARFADTHAKFGLRPSWGMSARLPRAVGWQTARLMTYTATPINATEALRVGLVARVIPKTEPFLPTVLALAGQITANSGQALAAGKQLYRHSAQTNLPGALRNEEETTFHITDAGTRLQGFKK